MKLTPYAITACLLLAQPAQALDITKTDNGGVIVLYAARFAVSRPIRVFAPCKSACAMAALGNDGCLGPGGSLWVHAPYGSTPLGNIEAKRYYMSQLGPKVRAWVRSQGGLKARLMRVPDYLVRKCRQQPKGKAR